jgi:hypothetical protein
MVWTAVFPSITFIAAFVQETQPLGCRDTAPSPHLTDGSFRAAWAGHVRSHFEGRLIGQADREWALKISGPRTILLVGKPK